MSKDKPQSTASGIAGFLALIIILWAGCKACNGCGDKKEDKVLTRKERIENLFSKWDGSQPAVVEWIKGNLNDPNSFEHLETRFIDKKDSIGVITEFTAKNAFGGRVRSTCVAQIDTLGNLKSAEIH